MGSNDGNNKQTGDHTPQKNKELLERKHPSRYSSTDYPSTKTTSSKTHISKRSSNPSSSSSNTRQPQGNHRGNTRLQHALRGVGSQFRDSARVETIQEEIEISPSTDTNSSDNQNPQRDHQQQHRAREPRVSQAKYPRTLNDTMRTYLRSQEDPSQQYALFCQSDTGQLSTQRGKDKHR